MKNYILVAEIIGLRVPCSLEFKSDKFVYLLYPNDVNERISSLKSKLNDLDNYYKNYQNNPIKNDQAILKDEDSITSIITEIQETDDSIENKPFDNLLDYFSIILKAFSLFYTSLFKIEKICVFRKIGFTTKLTRIIENYSEIELESPIGNELLENIDVRYFEPFFPKIIEKISRNKQFVDIFDEYINGKVIKRIEFKLVYLWNTLEHISERFLKTKKKNKVIQDLKFQELKELVQIKMSELKQSDLVFAENLEDARKIIVSKMNNYPQIIDKILYMFKKYKLYSKDTELLIRKLYYLRNQIFHSGVYLPKLLTKFQNQFPEEKSTSVNDLKDLLNKFEFMINNILIYLLEVNQILEIKNNNQLVWIENFPEDDTYFNFVVTTEDGTKIKQISEIFYSHFKTINILEAYIKKTIEYLSRRVKYLRLLQFLKRSQVYWRNMLSKIYIPSYIEGFDEKCLLKFDCEKSGYFKITTNSDFMKNIYNVINTVKGPKNLDFITYIYILNKTTIQLKLKLTRLIESLEHKGETRGEYSCSQLDSGNSEFNILKFEEFTEKGICVNCKNLVREIGIVNPKKFGKFFPIFTQYICNYCDTVISQELFIYPLISEQFVQIPIHIIEKGNCLRKGNGFFFVRIKDNKKHLFFITTYRIITGCLPSEDFKKSGESALLLFHTGHDAKNNIQIEIPLYTENNTPVWIPIENDHTNNSVIIPIFPQILQHCKINSLSIKNTEIPSDLSNELLLNVIGFNHGIFNDGIPQMFGFNLTKNEFLGLIQKPNIRIEPYEGMDGSPVFVINNKYKEGKFQHIFIGMYLDLQKGIILKSNQIIDQVDKIDIKNYFKEIYSKLPYMFKVAIK